MHRCLCNRNCWLWKSSSCAVSQHKVTTCSEKFTISTTREGKKPLPRESNPERDIRFRTGSWLFRVFFFSLTSKTKNLSRAFSFLSLSRSLIIPFSVWIVNRKCLCLRFCLNAISLQRCNAWQFGRTKNINTAVYNENNHSVVRFGKVVNDLKSFFFGTDHFKQ